MIIQEKLIPLYVLGILFFLMMASAARATLTFQISDGVNVFTVPDNGAADVSAQIGAVVYTNSFGNVALNVATGISKPMIGSAVLPELHLDGVIVSTGATNISIALSDTGFSGTGIHGLLASIGGIINSAPGSTATYSVYRDLSNSLFGTGPGTLVCTTGPLSGGSLLYFGGSCFANSTSGNAYSLTLVATIHNLGLGNSSFNAVLVDAPEPASIVLLLVGLIGATTWNWLFIIRKAPDRAA
jgi:hypothetical protein